MLGLGSLTRNVRSCLDWEENVIGEVAEIGQWNLHDKPKKVVFTMKDGWYSLLFTKTKT